MSSQTLISSRFSLVNWTTFFLIIPAQKSNLWATYCQYVAHRLDFCAGYLSHNYSTDFTDNIFNNNYACIGLAFSFEKLFIFAITFNLKLENLIKRKVHDTPFISRFPL